MQHPKFNNERGMTLVELLAALALFSIVIVLAGSLITSIGSSEKSVSSDLSLQQNTNVLINEIRQAYYNGKGTDNLQFNLDADKFDIKNDNIKNGNKKLDIVDNRYIKEVNYNKRLEIKLTTTSSTNEKNVKVDTVLRPTKPKQIVLNKDISLSCDIDNLENKKWKDINNHDDVELDENTFLKIKEFAIFDKQFELGEKSCIIIKGSADFHGEVELDEQTNTSIGGSAVFDKQFDLGENAQIDIGRKADFHRQTELGEQTNTSIGGPAVFDKQFDLDENAQIDIGEDADFHGEVELGEQTNTSIGGSAVFDKQFDLGENAQIDIGRKADFHRQVTLDEKSVLNIDRNATFDGKVEIDENVYLKIKGDATFNGELEVEGDDANICVNGKISPSDLEKYNNCSEN